MSLLSSSPTQYETLQRLLDERNRGDEKANHELIAFSLDKLKRMARLKMRHFQRLRPHVSTNDLLNASVVRLDRALRELEVPTVLDYLKLSATMIRREALDLGRKQSCPHGIAANERRIDPPHGSGFSVQALDRPDSSPSPAKLAAAAELWEKFHQMADDLEAPLQEVFDLVFVHRFTQKEAARMLGISEKAVYKRLTKFRRRLGEILRELDDL